MANSLGALTVALGLDAAEFTRGLTKSEYQARQFAESVRGGLVTGAKAAGAALAIVGTSALGALAAVDNLVKGAADFKDLEETTGASAESLASFAVAAGTAGVSVESIGAAANKLTKNLVGVDDESKAAGAALAALGLNVKQFKELDPAAQYEAVGKALAGYADGASKVAVAQALFGKSGAEQLKVFKALEEQGGRTKILTQQQIEQADAYADSQAKASAQLKLYAQAAATEALPAIDSLTTAGKAFFSELVGIDEASGRLAANSGVRDFANGIVDALAFVVDAGRGVVQVFQSIGVSLGAGAAAAAAVARGEVRQAIEIARQGREDIDRILSATSFRDRLAAARAAASAAVSTPKPDLPRLTFSGADKPERTRSAKTDEAAKYLEQLQRQLEATKNLSVEETLLADIQRGRLGNVTEAQREGLLGVARQLDAVREQRKEFELQQQTLDEVADSQRRLTEAGLDLFQKTRTPLELLNQELERFNRLLEAGVIDADTLARATGEAFRQYDETFKKVKTEADEFTKQAASNIQDQLGSSIYDALTGNFDRIDKAFADLIIRLAAQATAAQLGKYLFGDFGKTGEIGGVFGDLGKYISGTTGGTASGGGGFGSIISGIAGLFGGGLAGGGTAERGKFYEVNERRPELLSVNGRDFLMMGSQRGKVIPNPQVSGGRSQVNNITVNVPETTTRTSGTQLAAEIQRRIAAGSRNL